MPTKLEKNHKIIETIQGLVAEKAVIVDANHVEITFSAVRTVEVPSDGKLSLIAVSVVDDTHVEAHYWEETEISEADSWRDKNPDEFTGLTDEQVLAKVPVIQEANEAIEKYGHYKGDIMAGLTAEEVLLLRDELDQELADIDAQEAAEAAKQAEDDAAMQALTTALKEANMTPAEMIARLVKT